MVDQRDKGGKSGADRREWHRVRVDLEVDYGNRDNFLFAYISDISATGIFVRTNNPEKPGTLLNLRFTPDDGQREMLQLEGEVIWVNTYRPGNPDNIAPGMGIRFVDLTNESRARLTQYIKTFAYPRSPRSRSERSRAKRRERQLARAPLNSSEHRTSRRSRDYSHSSSSARTERALLTPPLAQAFHRPTGHCAQPQLAPPSSALQRTHMSQRPKWAVGRSAPIAITRTIGASDQRPSRSRQPLAQAQASRRNSTSGQFRFDYDELAP